MLIMFAVLATAMFLVSVTLMVVTNRYRDTRPKFGALNCSLALAQLASTAALSLAILTGVILGMAGSLALLVSCMLVIGWLTLRRPTLG